MIKQFCDNCLAELTKHNKFSNNSLDYVEFDFPLHSSIQGLDKQWSITITARIKDRSYGIFCKKCVWGKIQSLFGRKNK